MFKIKTISYTFLILFFATLSSIAGGASLQIPETDNPDEQLVGFFDLRDRESFIQVTNTGSSPLTLHIQVFNVNDNCNENDFFDIYTPNDTHTYNLRDLLTNDGNPSGVVLPNDAYGAIAISTVDDFALTMIGNLRVVDNNGYEYRTNLIGTGLQEFEIDESIITFNFNSNNGVILSDIVGFVVANTSGTDEVEMSEILSIWALADIDIFDNIENPFSCRNIIYSCVDQDNPLLESLLEEVADEADTSANVASFEYGINEAIPHSKGGELLCPGNTINEGFVRLNLLEIDVSSASDTFYIFYGLNNGDGRGTIDTGWYGNEFTDIQN